jgi:hypothetical protein
MKLLRYALLFVGGLLSGTAIAILIIILLKTID